MRSCVEMLLEKCNKCCFYWALLFEKKTSKWAKYVHDIYCSFLLFQVYGIQIIQFQKFYHQAYYFT